MVQIPTTDKPQQYIEVRQSEKFNTVMFDCDPNKQRVWIYCKETASINFDKRYQYFVDWHSPRTDIHITTDQWNHFIKRLSLLAAPIRSLMVQLNIDVTKSFLIKRPDTSAILGIRWTDEPIPPIEIYGTESEDYGKLLNRTEHMVPYDPQLDGYISRFMKEIRETMNEWLHLN